MTNVILISGKIEELQTMSENIILGTLICDDTAFYIFWESENFQMEDLEGKYVCIQGYLTYVKFRREGKETSHKTAAIHVDQMETLTL